MTEDNRIPDALRAHLLHCGFVDPDDNTVPIFTGNDPHFAWTSVDKMVAALTARFEISDRQAAPRVFFPGDTVPAGVAVLYRKPSGLKLHVDDEPWEPNFGPMWEITVPSPEEWQAAVDRARAAREENPDG